MLLRRLIPILAVVCSFGCESKESASSNEVGVRPPQDRAQDRRVEEELPIGGGITVGCHVPDDPGIPAKVLEAAKARLPDLVIEAVRVETDDDNCLKYAVHGIAADAVWNIVLLETGEVLELTKGDHSARKEIFSSEYWKQHFEKFPEDLHEFRVDIDRTIFDLEDRPITDAEDNGEVK